MFEGILPFNYTIFYPTLFLSKNNKVLAIFIPSASKKIDLSLFGI